jgi:mono/diheme cytochrome c family protein
MIKKTLSLSIVLFFSASVISFQAWNDMSEAKSAQARVDYARDIQPIFRASCDGCHGAKKQMGNLRLDSKQIALAKVIVPGKASESPLYQRVAGIGDQARMPMGGDSLKKEQIELIRRWIDEGADWPEDNRSASGAGSDPQSAISQHWAYVAPLRPAPPKVNNTAWVKNPIDRFILARLEKERLKPSPEADRVTLLRRLSLDLIGLPPTPEEVDAFLKDNSPKAYEKQVERLLNSPHYGGGASGSTPHVMPIPTATKRTSSARCGSTAIG